MSMIFIPIRMERNPLWKFEGEWSAEDMAIVESILSKHEHKQKTMFGQPKTWLLVCCQYGQEKDYHAGQAGDVILYGRSSEELAQNIDRYYVTGNANSTIISSSDTSNPPEEESKDDWLSDLRAIREQDQQNLQLAQRQSEKTRQKQADTLLHNSQAHNLLRQVQKVLLNGEGLIKAVNEKTEYDSALVLLWQGPISAARKPARSNETCNYILVGVREGVLYVNDEKLPDFSVEAVKESLLKACRHPLKAIIND